MEKREEDNLEKINKKILFLISTIKSINSKEFSAIKMYIALNLWLWLAEELFNDENKDPTKSFESVLDNHLSLVETIKKNKIHIPNNFVKEDSFQDNIGETFKDIWLQYSLPDYFIRTFNDTRDRYLANNIDPNEFYADKYVLDAGCGSGKVTSAIARFGAKKVVGIDLTIEGINFAKEKSKEFPEGRNIEYIQGNCKDLPFPDNTFDIVHSNGVVHHTDDYEKCIKELHRVLKPKGNLWIFVMGRSGMFEIIADCVRKIMEDVDRSAFMKFLQSLGFSSGRIYWITDHCYAKYHWKSREDFESLLKSTGFSNLFSFKRGINIDQNELLFNNKPFSKLKFGEGQLKYIATKN